MILNDTVGSLYPKRTREGRCRWSSASRGSFPERKRRRSSSSATRCRASSAWSSMSSTQSPAGSPLNSWVQLHQPLTTPPSPRSSRAGPFTSGSKAVARAATASSSTTDRAEFRSSTLRAIPIAELLRLAVMIASRSPNPRPSRLEDPELEDFQSDITTALRPRRGRRGSLNPNVAAAAGIYREEVAAGRKPGPTIAAELHVTHSSARRLVSQARAARPPRRLAWPRPPRRAAAQRRGLSMRDDDPPDPPRIPSPGSVTGMAASGGNRPCDQHDREAALLRFAYLKAMIGQPDPQQRKSRREAENAAAEAKRCFRCDQDLSTSRVFRVAHSIRRTWFGGHSFVAVPLCQSCSSSSGRYAARAYEARCPVCQRDFVNFSGRPSRYCSPRCRQDGRRLARAQQRGTPDCEACGTAIRPRSGQTPGTAAPRAASAPTA